MGADIEKRLDKYVDDALYYFDLPGIAVDLKKDDLQYSRVAGYRDFIKQEPLRAGDIFHMASVSKLFTATAVMMLAERGLISIDDRLINVLPWISIDDDRLDSIRIIHMLTHTSGIADICDYHWDEPQTDDDALKRYCTGDEVSRSRLLFNPGKTFRYSNMAYEILGMAVAEISGQTFESFVAENIFEPLDMKDSTFLTFNRDMTELAMPHKKDKAKHIVREETYPYNRMHGPSSTLTSNGRDLGKWAAANLEKRILRPETIEKMHQVYALVPNNGEEMGIGWFMREQEGHRLYGHEGTDDGFRSSFWICPGMNGYIAVTANITGAPVKKINKGLFEMLMK